MPRTRRRRTLDLFSGIGGLSLALAPYCKTIAYVDNDASCQTVLLARMKTKHIDTAPVISDVCSFRTGRNRVGIVERIVGGFPCQDISSQGKRKGFGGDKSSLFYCLMDAVRQFEPEEVLLENVAHILTMPAVWKAVFQSLRNAGYKHIRWATVAAGDVGAPHLRRRCFFLAQKRRVDAYGRPAPMHGGTIPDISGICRTFNQKGWKLRRSTRRRGEPSIPRFKQLPPGAASIQRLNKRLHQLGNAVCPAQGRFAFECLWNGGGDAGKKLGKMNGLRTLPKWGYIAPSGHIYTIHQSLDSRCRKWPPRRIIPPKLTAIERKKYRGKAPILTEPFETGRWPTPLTRYYLPSRYLTRRRSNDLGSALFYDSDTSKTERQSIRVNPMFIEWMMGFPPNYTKV